jgi:hypothetical protein
MTEIQERELSHSIAEKLHPTRFPNVSGKMFAALAALLGVRWVEPHLASILATSDGKLMGRLGDDVGFNEFLGEFADFERNALGMAEAAASLTEVEHEHLITLLSRVSAGEESSSGKTASDLAIRGIDRSNN